MSVVAEMSSEDLAARALRLARAFMDQGVTFDLDGEERPFPLDVVPRIFTTKEWQVISDGVAQRVRALEAFLDDIYNSARILHDGSDPTPTDHELPGIPPFGQGGQPAERREDPGRWDRHRERRRRLVRRARGQPEEPLGGQLRARQPCRDGTGATRDLLGPADPASG